MFSSWNCPRLGASLRRMFPHLPYTLDLVGKVTTPTDHGKVMAPQAHDKGPDEHRFPAAPMPGRARQDNRAAVKSGGRSAPRRQGARVLAAGLPTTTCSSSERTNAGFCAPAARESP